MKMNKKAWVVLTGVVALCVAGGAWAQSNPAVAGEAAAKADAAKAHAHHTTAEADKARAEADAAKAKAAAKKAAKASKTGDAEEEEEARKP